MLVGLLILTPCLVADEPPTDQSTESTPDESAPESPEPLHWGELHNVFQHTQRITSGSGPETDADFAELAKQGVKTVVSVDGARPKVELAKRHGLRYVHIPIGYDGLPREAQLALGRVVEDTEGTLYIHCHHGKHRGPAAAAVACMSNGAIDHTAAAHILETAGTGANYHGLWRDVAEYQQAGPDEKLPPLVETAKVNNMVQAMSSIDAAMEHLQLLSANKWQPLAEHPDLAPKPEAVILWEGFRESARFAAADDDGHKQLESMLQSSVAAANQLRTEIEAGHLEAATQQVASLKASCKQCHEKFRDNR
ncbi:cytochrome c [Aeoliella sp. ICT_H6.2]|uniref:Cytochrome c n=1 Tax=Aeoliella straminimaris TaxID=2954799 RepID=A0A9X2FGC8_9BACT|nr:cytochrome c [Aeoliella straminimaris]MCO6047843.1 cytochrome c [Aeoliella straminimaris]